MMVCFLLHMRAGIPALLQGQHHGVEKRPPASAFPEARPRATIAGDFSKSIMSASDVPAKWQWFNEARFGLFIHWGPASAHGRGEQVLMRELLDQRDYAAKACAWNPRDFDARQWARIAKRAGMRYAVFVTRHHDGYSMWDTRVSDYSSAAQAPKRDFVREYADAFRAEGLRIGLYYSWNDMRVPAQFAGPEGSPEEWETYINYVHTQLRELMGNYGQIDELWLDGVWPHSARTWRSAEAVRMIRGLQPEIIINNRLGFAPGFDTTKPAAGVDADAGINEGGDGDFGTPEHHITPAPGRLWESCQTSTWRLWGYCPGERWRPADLLLDFLCETSAKGGNLLLNVGPKPDGAFPDEFIQRAEEIGDWLKIHGEAVYGTQPCDAGESVLFGWQTRKNDTVYLIVRFWHGTEIHFQGLATPVRRATLLTTGDPVAVKQNDHGIVMTGLPVHPPTSLFPVIKLELDGEPRTHATFSPHVQTGDPKRLISWARARNIIPSAGPMI